MSRPKKNADARLCCHLTFRLTAQEFEEHCRVAERAGLSPNELARRLNRKQRGLIVIQTFRRCDPAFLKRIDRIGHNLNQLVKNAHIFGRISPHIEPLCATIDQLIMQAIEEDVGDGS